MPWLQQQRASARAPDEGCFLGASRRPRFKLFPSPPELSKLDAKLKARQRAVLFGGVSVEPVVKMSIVEW